MTDETERRPQRADSADRSPAITYGTFSSILADVIVWMGAVELAALARVDFEAAQVHWELTSVLALFLAGGQLVLGPS